MRVLIIDKTAVLPTSRAKWRLLNKQPNVELMLFCPNRWMENYTPLRFEPHPEDDYPIIKAPVLFPGYGNRGLYLRGLVRTIRTFQPDIVHCMEEVYSLFALQTVWAMRWTGCRGKLLCYAWENLAWNFRYAYRPGVLYKNIERYVLKKLAHAVVANRETADVLRNHGYTGPVSVIYYGTDLNAFTPGVETAFDGPANRREPVIGYIGRLIPAKGVDVLFEAAAGLPGCWSLCIVGGGEAKISLENRAFELGITDRIRWVDVVNHADIPRLLRGMQALVLPSLTTATWKEQYGRVLVEAMACGVPVVGSDSGAIPEVIGDAGLVFPEGNTTALNECLRKIIESPDEAANLSRKGSERARRLFSNEAFVDGVLRIYRKLIEG